MFLFCGISSSSFVLCSLLETSIFFSPGGVSGGNGDLRRWFGLGLFLVFGLGEVVLLRRLDSISSASHGKGGGPPQKDTSSGSGM